jgi:hypothetical protein
MQLACKQKTTCQVQRCTIHSVKNHLWMRWILTRNIKPPWWWHNRSAKMSQRWNKCVKLKYSSSAQSWFIVSISKYLYAEVAQFWRSDAIIWYMYHIPEKGYLHSCFHECQISFMKAFFMNQFTNLENNTNIQFFCLV